MTTSLKIASGVIALLAVWLGTLAGVMALDDSAPAALVLMPGDVIEAAPTGTDGS